MRARGGRRPTWITNGERGGGSRSGRGGGSGAGGGQDRQLNSVEEVSYSWLKSTGRRRRTRVRSGTAGKREREGAAAAAAAMEEEAEEEVEEEVEVLSDGRRFVSQLTGNLYITRVEGTDAGRYSCVVRSKARGEHGAGVDRVERSPPTPLLLRPGGVMGAYEPRIEATFPSKIIAVQGHNLKLECFALGNPVPRLSWSRAGGELPPSARLSESGSLLEIREVRESDGGTYTCSARNAAGGNAANGTVTVRAAPRWLLPLRDAELGVHEALRWPCRASGSPAPSYAWLKNGSPLATTSSSSTTSSSAHGRVRVASHASGDLLVSPLLLSDAAMYQCVASNSFGSVTSAARLRVSGSVPDFVGHELPAETVAVRGGRTIIPCRPRAWPAPRVTWSGPSGTVGPSASPRLHVLEDGSLMFASVASGDAGSYSCTAHNVLGQAQSAGKLTVKEATRITAAPSGGLVAFGHRAVLSCRASHDPSLRVAFLWSRGGHHLALGGSGRREQFTHAGMGSSASDLVLKSVSPADSGAYSCTAHTDVDSATASTWLNVTGPPDPPHSVVATDVTTTSVSLSWVPGFDNYSPARAHRVESRCSHCDRWTTATTEPAIVAADRRGARVTGLTPWTEAEFRVVSSNAHGDGVPSASSGFLHTLPTGCSPPPLTTAAAPPNRVHRSSPVERHLHFGPNLGYVLAFRENATASLWRHVTVPAWNASRYSHHRPAATARPFEAFLVRIRAFNGAGEGPFSNATLVHSAERAPTVAPLGVRARALSSSEVEVAWQALPPALLGEQRIDGYEVAYRRSVDAPKGATTLLRTPGGTKDRVRLLGLREHAEYEVTVRAFNGAGTGPSGAASLVTTRKAPPSKPPRITQWRTDGVHVTLSWEHVAPLDNESAVTGYKVRYRSLGQTGARELLTNETRVEIPLPLGSGGRGSGGVGAALVVEVRACSAEGEGSASTQVRVPHKASSGMKLGGSFSSAGGKAMMTTSPWGLTLIDVALASLLARASFS
ncbi:contactin-4-like [Petromyzon marinus]|uniref:contactin-4-like n=1 Tax=Petromyzon marinus TaxID=7757 RepID=UPI003F6F9E1C